MTRRRAVLSIVLCCLAAINLTDAAPVRVPSKTECEVFAKAGSCVTSDQFMSQYCGQACHEQLRRERLQRFETPIADSFFDLTADDIDGNQLDFYRFKGKVTVVVNVASECGE